MDDTFFDLMTDRMEFGPDDAGRVKALETIVRPELPGVADRFYEWLFKDPAAVRVFSGGPEQMRRQREVFVEWLNSVFSGEYDAAYFHRLAEIGQRHVHVGLPQHYVPAAMHRIWQELRDLIRQAGVADGEAKLASLHKLLILEMAIMLEAHAEHHTHHVREEERTAAEEKLTHSEHLAQLGQLAASLAHEIKNPLAGISGAIQVIRDGMSPDDDRQPVIREILSQINRVDATVKDLLVYARPRPPEMRLCDLHAIAVRTLKSIREAPAMRRVRVTVDCADNVPPVPADMRQIEQLFMNLIFNAAHASSEGETIRVSLRAQGPKVILSITDRGSGMDQETAVRAFEPFFTTRAKGTGLGLPICRKIVEAHGGKIALQSQRGSGTQVTVELPQDGKRD
jgi:signal transduction histidine kinase